MFLFKRRHLEDVFEEVYLLKARKSTYLLIEESLSLDHPKINVEFK